MKYNPTTCPGLGDEITWGPIISANDPRAPAAVEWDLMSDEQRREELEQLPYAELVEMLLLEFRRV